MKRPKDRAPKSYTVTSTSTPRFSEQIELPKQNKVKKFPLSDYLVRGNLDYLGVTYQPSFSEMARFEKFGELAGRGEFLSTLEYTLGNFKKILVRKEKCITIPWFLGSYKFLRSYHLEGVTKPEYRKLEEAIEKYETKILELEDFLRRKKR